METALCPSYASGFAPRDGTPRYPSLRKGLLGEWSPGLGPTGTTLFDWSGNQMHGILSGFPTNAWRTLNGQYALFYENYNSGHTVTLPTQMLTATSGISEFSISMWASCSQYAIVGTSNTGFGVFRWSTGFEGLYLYPYDTNSGNGTRVYFNGYNVIDINTGAIDDGRLHHFCLVQRNSSYRELFVDGVSVATDTTNLSFLTVYDSAFIGRYYKSGALNDIRFYTRALTGNEVSWLSRRPNIAFELTDRTRVFAPDVPNSYVIDCSHGTFSIAGQAAGLLRSERLSCSHGTVALTGQPADLQWARRVSCTHGSLTLAVQSAGLSHAARLNCSTGTLALAAQAAGAVHGALLNCTAGSVAATGYGADVLTQRYLSAEHAAVSLSGQTADLTRTALLDCGHATCSLSGQSVIFTSGRDVAAASGHLTLGLSDARLVRDLVFSAEADTMSVSGADASLNVGVAVVCEFAEFSADGHTANFTRAWQIPADVAMFAATEQVCVIRASRLLLCSVSSFACSGADAATRRSMRSDAAVAVFALTGVNAALTKSSTATVFRSRRLFVSGGLFV